MGSSIGKALTGAAGLLLLVGVLKATFYVVKVGQRGVLMRGGQPVLKNDGRCYAYLAEICTSLWIPSFALWFAGRAALRQSRQVGTYKIKRPGVKVMFPGLYGVDKVNVQQRIQELRPVDVDCLDGQHHIVPELVTQVLCDDDGPEFYDYPARSIIKSSEADQVFESFAGTELLSILENSTKAQRQNREELLQKLVDTKVAQQIDEVGYVLKGVNLRQRSLTPIQKAIDAFAPQPIQNNDAEQDDATLKEIPNNVLDMPHPIVMAVALPDIANNS